jgi:hypothetical protein
MAKTILKNSVEQLFDIYHSISDSPEKEKSFRENWDMIFSQLTDSMSVEDKDIMRNRRSHL